MVAVPPLRRWSLRTKLVTGLVALLAVVCALVGVGTSLALEHYQLAQLDGQLQASAQRARGDGDRLPPPQAVQQGPEQGFQQSRCRSTSDSSAAEVPRSIAFIGAPGQTATLAASLSGRTVTAAGYVDADGCIHVLGATDAAALQDVSVGGGARTVAVGALGDCRVVAVRLQNGAVVVTGRPLAGLRATQRRLVEAEVAVSAAALVIAVIAAAAVVRGALRPLRRVAATATQVSAMPLDRGEVALGVRVPEPDTDPRTEVGQVGAALNTLLGHVGSALAARHDSETRVRQFVADASHELRTPLASIRGYAELVNRDPGALPPGAAHAMGRVESEAKRMTGLVEDLLLLARLDSGRPLEREPVDLTRLVLDAVSDASAAGQDHRWRIDVPDEPVEVVGDAARLHQVLANLLTNARTHTPPGTSVTASLRTTTPGQVVLAVLDDGPGIPPRPAGARLRPVRPRGHLPLAGRGQQRAGAGDRLRDRHGLRRQRRRHEPARPDRLPRPAAHEHAGVPGGAAGGDGPARGALRPLVDGPQDHHSAATVPGPILPGMTMDYTATAAPPLDRSTRGSSRTEQRRSAWTRLTRGRVDAPRWERPALLGLLALTAVLHLVDLGASGWANSFYSAAVQAGSVSWKAFLFGSSDAGNSITVDKPPASLWVMAASVRVFGLSSWSILVPQALMGVATAGVLHAAVRRHFPAGAALLAGGVLALTPVAALMFRFDNPDALLVLLMTGAAYAVVRAVEDGRTRWMVAISSWVESTFTAQTVGGVTLYDLTSATGA